jgi:hypothetical protein
MQHSFRTPHAPDHAPSVREILEEKGNFLEETLDQIDREDTRRGGNWDGFCMVDLLHHAHTIDDTNRLIMRDMRKQEARQRLCRIIAGMYTRAVIEGDCDECDRLADALVLATRTWCNG